MVPYKIAIALLRNKPTSMEDLQSPLRGRREPFKATLFLRLFSVLHTETGTTQHVSSQLSASRTNTIFKNLMLHQRPVKASCVFICVVYYFLFIKILLKTFLPFIISFRYLLAMFKRQNDCFLDSKVKN